MKTLTTTILTLLSIWTSYSQTAQDYTKTGLDKYYSADYEGAIKDFTKVIALDPTGTGGYLSN